MLRSSLRRRRGPTARRVLRRAWVAATCRKHSQPAGACGTRQPLAPSWCAASTGLAAGPVARHPAAGVVWQYWVGPSRPVRPVGTGLKRKGRPSCARPGLHTAGWHTAYVPRAGVAYIRTRLRRGAGWRCAGGAESYVGGGGQPIVGGGRAQGEDHKQLLRAAAGREPVHLRAKHAGWARKESLWFCGL